MTESTLRIYDAAAVRAALPFDRLVPALRAAFAEGSDVPPRHHHHVSGSETTLLLMPAWARGQHIGVKLVNVVPGNAALGLPAIQAAYLLADYATGRWLALLNGNEITARRTAAASALAASFLAREEAATLLIVGTGRVASLLAQAHRAVRPIGRVLVWARQEASASALAADLCGEGFEATPAPDLEAAVRQADIISCATLSKEPLVRGAWLAPGTHLDLIGSFAPDMRESDDEAVRRAAIYVDTAEALAQSGDLCQIDVTARGTLAGLCDGSAPGRRDAGEITLFKSVGTALEDLVAAGLVVGT